MHRQAMPFGPALDARYLGYALDGVSTAVICCASRACPDGPGAERGSC
jgi:hypothetical protein